ncbi:YrrS family protein [Ornithinibacillus halophilus]|uniref:DUF1510 domain-containing protein n=1 Tax=Ornithinibacillus halophilus TaxID=930117 RepID=A0A1M5DJ91_9BACI|nr:YrrS family protein [Ornithinibacillus halophilus]SHF66986.1 Protein of unknown function [Ornithinibacillus halophilus]
MSNFDSYSRVNKFEKRRKNTKAISALLIIGGLLVIALVGIWLFGGDDDETADGTVNTSETNNDNSDSEVAENGNDDGQNDEDDGEGSFIETETDEQDDAESETEDPEDSSTNGNYNEEQEFETEPAEGSGDDIVIDSFTSSDWKPIGTEQEEPHTLFGNDLDRIEMEKAIRVATRLDENNMVTWWLKNNGPQKVIGTVSDREETVIYRVYLSWIENQGWQPTLVEELSENDEKWRFESQEAQENQETQGDQNEDEQ